MNLEQRSRVVCRPTRRGRLRPGKPQLGQIKLVDEGVDRADRLDAVVKSDRRVRTGMITAPIIKDC